MRKLLIAPLIAAIMLSGAFAQKSAAAEFSGAYLLRLCNFGPDGKETVAGGHAACQSYIAGVIDYHNLIRSLGTAPSVDFCVPDKTTLYDLQMAVVRYLTVNGQHDGFVAAPAVALALFDVYPCKKRK